MAKAYFKASKENTSGSVLDKEEGGSIIVKRLILSSFLSEYSINNFVLISDFEGVEVDLRLKE